MTATISAAVLGLVNAALQVVVAFGVNLTDNQNAAITALVNAVLIVSALVYELVRKQSPAAPAAPPTAGTGG